MPKKLILHTQTIDENYRIEYSVYIEDLDFENATIEYNAYGGEIKSPFIKCKFIKFTGLEIINALYKVHMELKLTWLNTKAHWFKLVPTITTEEKLVNVTCDLKSILIKHIYTHNYES